MVNILKQCNAIELVIPKSEFNVCSRLRNEDTLVWILLLKNIFPKEYCDQSKGMKFFSQE